MQTFFLTSWVEMENEADLMSAPLWKEQAKKCRCHQPGSLKIYKNQCFCYINDSGGGSLHLSLSCSIVIQVLNQRILSGLHLFSSVCLARSFLRSLTVSGALHHPRARRESWRDSCCFAFNPLLTCSLPGVELLKRKRNIMEMSCSLFLNKNTGGIITTLNDEP